MRLSAWARLEGRFTVFEHAQNILARVRTRMRDEVDAGILGPDLDIDAAVVLIDATFKGYWDRRDHVALYTLDSETMDER
jgi:hypothetical protein